MNNEYQEMCEYLQAKRQIVSHDIIFICIHRYRDKTKALVISKNAKYSEIPAYRKKRHDL